jgi:hypothetical protein
MIRKLSSGGYRLYSRKRNPKTGKRRNLGTFGTRREAEARGPVLQVPRLSLAAGTVTRPARARHTIGR